MHLASLPRLFAALLALVSASFVPVVRGADTPLFFCGCLIFVDDAGPAISVPLESTAVTLDVKPGLMETQVIQTFTNRTDKALEATYMYPLPGGATLTEFELHYRDRVVRSQVREKVVARAIYNAAKAEGRKTALLEQRDPSLFSTAVANFLPGESVRVVLRFIQPLDFSSDAIEVRFPMVTTDKYFPAGAAPGSEGNSAAAPARRPAELVAPNHVYAFDIQVTGIPVQTIESPSHRVKWARPDANSDRVTVSLQNEITIPDRDFVLRIAPRAGASLQPTLVTQRTATGEYGLLTVFPPQKQASSVKPAQGRDVLFLLDRSGSMGGERFKSAKIGLAACLASLAPQDRFQVMIFDDQFEFYRPGWSQATPQAVAEAHAYVGGLDVRGGTEMQPALAAALEAFEAGNRSQILIFLTDGDVGNAASLLNLLERKIGQVRLFPFGIGAAPHATLIKQMAEAGRGQARFIGDDTAIARELVDLFASLDAPVLSRVQLNLLDAQGRPMEHAAFPERLPDVFVGRPIQTVFRMKNGLPGWVSIEGLEDERRVTHRLALQQSPLAGSGLEKQFGQRLFDDLGVMLRRAGNDQERDLVRQEMLATALQFQLVTELTSRVAVSDEIERDPAATLVSEEVAQYHVADGATSGYFATETLSGARVATSDGEAVVLSPFEVSTEGDRGYICCGAMAGTAGRRPLGLTEIFYDRGGSDPTAALEELMFFTLDAPQTGSLALLDELPIATAVDPRTIDQIILRPLGLRRAEISQQRAGRVGSPVLTLGMGDEGFFMGSAKISGRLPGTEWVPSLGLVSWARGRHEQTSVFLDTEKKFTGGRLRTTMQVRELKGFGAMRFVRGTFEHSLHEDVMLEAAIAWHTLRRDDPRQFRLGSPAMQYEGLGLFNLDALTAENSQLDDVFAHVRLSGISERWGATQKWFARAYGHRQGAAWLSPRAGDAIAGRRDSRGFDLGYRGRWLNNQLEIDAQLGSAAHRTPGASVEHASTHDWRMSANWALNRHSGLFAAWSREMELPWLTSGRWQHAGSNLHAVLPPPETREGVQAGVSLNAPYSPIRASLAVYHEDLHQHAYRDWNWERTHMASTGPVLVGGELYGPMIMRPAPEFSREGLMASVSFGRDRARSLEGTWWQDWKDAGPYRGGNQRASIVGRHAFRSGRVKGWVAGFALNYRNRLIFDDGYALHGGLTADLMAGYHLGGKERHGTLVQLNVANIADRSWQSTRFAPDYGRRVRLSLSREF